MSLKLKFDGITDWKIGNDYFRRGTFSHVCPTDSGAWVRAQNADWCFMSHTASGGGLVLDMGPRVWLDVWVWDGLRFSRGGYLEEVEHQYNFSGVDDGQGGTTYWTQTIKTLGVRADTYTGGVKIEGIASPPNSWTDITANYPGVTTGAIYVSYSGSFVWNNRVIDITNWRASGAGIRNSTGRLSAVVCGAIANNIQWSVDGLYH